ncbi:DM13 domain-containing protein [Nocardioides panacisoli]|uniref:DM13 domain-containing protein n=1 Tax=Nocardioides panacisoli TaxID=627624 RepID=A0ABP7I6W0_9ACTN
MGRKRRVGLGVGAVVAAAVLVVGLLLFEPWLLWVDDTVDEDLPDAVPADATTPTGGPPGQSTSTVAEWTELSSSGFVSGEHGTSGTARVVRNADGSLQVWLEDLDTSNGPDLHVWLTDQDSGGDCGGCSDSWGIYDDGRHVELGALKGNRGDQRYDVPADADLAGLVSVVIWCDRFNVAFGTAAVDRIT